MFLRNKSSCKIILTALSLAFLTQACSKKDTLIVLDEKTQISNNLNAISGQIVVRFLTPVTDDFVVSFASTNNLKTLKYLKKINTALFQLTSNSNIDTVLTELSNNSSVDYAERNYKTSVNYTVSDERAKDQNGLAVAKFPKAWDITFGNKNVIVAVIDTGADLNHPDLKNKLVQGYNVVEPDKQPIDDNGHGTHVCGIVGAETNNKIGIAGGAPDCKIMPIKVLKADGHGDTVGPAYGIVWAVDHGAKVLNLSLGGPQNETVKRAVEYALAKNVVVVAAMGNSAKIAEEENKPSLLKAYPAAIPGVIAVGAMDYSRESGYTRAYFSNYGNWISVVAPGMRILSTMPTYDFFMKFDKKTLSLNNYDFLQGTSQASPMVASVAALILSRYPNYTNQEVKSKIESTATDIGKKGFDDKFGYGLINAYKAVL